jgi:hypothetical protein
MYSRGKGVLAFGLLYVAYVQYQSSQNVTPRYAKCSLVRSIEMTFSFLRSPPSSKLLSCNFDRIRA